MLITYLPVLLSPYTVSHMKQNWDCAPSFPFLKNLVQLFFIWLSNFPKPFHMNYFFGSLQPFHIKIMKLNCNDIKWTESRAGWEVCLSVPDFPSRLAAHSEALLSSGTQMLPGGWETIMLGLMSLLVVSPTFPVIWTTFPTKNPPWWPEMGWGLLCLDFSSPSAATGHSLQPKAQGLSWAVAQWGNDYQSGSQGTWVQAPAN